MQPASVAQNFQGVTRSHRHLYWTVAPATLHPAAIAHATLGCALLPQTAGATRQALAVALSETYRAIPVKPHARGMRLSQRPGQYLKQPPQRSGINAPPQIPQALLGDHRRQAGQ
jgi:hypothetical protein